MSRGPFYLSFKSPVPAAASEAQNRIELQARQRAVERAGLRLSEGAEQSRRPLRKVARQRQRDAWFESVADEETMHAHVRREAEVAPVVGRKDGVLLRTDEGVVEEGVAARKLVHGQPQQVLADLALGPVALTLLVREPHIAA